MKTVTSGNNDADDRARGDRSYAAMGGIVMRGCDHCNRDGGGDADTVDGACL